MDLLMALASGFTLGALHAFDADHVAAVSALATRTHRARSAVRLGVMWGLGHSLVLLAVGGTLTALGWTIPLSVQDAAEVGVGFLLIGLGLWTIWRVRREWHPHVHHHVHDGSDHVHVHAHPDSDASTHEHQHHHSMFAIGAAHGLAGTGTVVVLIPVALAQSPMTAALFLACFGIGTMLAMAMFSLIVNVAVQAARSVRSLAIFRAVAGGSSLVIGLWWISERLL
jgi:sulfite exporter TauE/SafE